MSLESSLRDVKPFGPDFLGQRGWLVVGIDSDSEKRVKIFLTLTLQPRVNAAAQNFSCLPETEPVGGLLVRAEIFHHFVNNCFLSGHQFSFEDINRLQ